MEKEVEKVVQQLSVMFESPKDAIQVIDEVILPMRGEIVKSVFWNAVRAELESIYNSVPGEKLALKQQQDFVQPMGGFQIRVMENSLLTKGKGTLMLHPDDYKQYMEKVLSSTRNSANAGQVDIAKFVREDKNMIILNGKEYEKVIREGASVLPRPGDVVVHEGKLKFEFEIPIGYTDEFLEETDYYAKINNFGCSLYRPK